MPTIKKYKPDLNRSEFLDLFEDGIGQFGFKFGYITDTLDSVYVYKEFAIQYNYNDMTYDFIKKDLHISGVVILSTKYLETLMDDFKGLLL